MTDTVDWTQTLASKLSGDASDRETMTAFVEKVRSFAYSPQNRAASDRLQPFSKNAALIAAIRACLESRVGALGDDGRIIPDWCMVVCLIQDGAEPSLQTLQRLATQAIESNDVSRLALFVRYFGQYESDPGIAALSAATSAHFAALIARSSAVTWAKSLGIKHPEYPGEWAIQCAVADQAREKAWGPPPESAHVLTLAIGNRPLTTHGEFWTLKLACSAKGGTMLWWAGGDTRPCEANDGRRMHLLPNAPQLATLPQFARELQSTLGFELDFSQSMDFLAKGIRQKDAGQRVLRWLAGD